MQLSKASEQMKYLINYKWCIFNEILKHMNALMYRCRGYWRVYRSYWKVYSSLVPSVADSTCPEGKPMKLFDYLPLIRALASILSPPITAPRIKINRTPHHLDSYYQFPSFDSASSGLTKSVTPRVFVDRKATAVPKSQFSRFVRYAGLAAGMGIGALGESIRQTAGGKEKSNIFLNSQNMNRLVTTLSQMRGASLKLGQMLSIQDNQWLPPSIQKALEQLQNAADYMPEKQMNQVSMGPICFHRTCH